MFSKNVKISSFTENLLLDPCGRKEEWAEGKTDGYIERYDEFNSHF
jgi:hypothetical protein